MRLSKRMWAATGAAVVVLAAANPAGAAAPAVGPVRVAPANAFRPDPAVSGLGVASDGTDRVVVHGSFDGGLTVDRFRGTSGPLGRPVTVDPFEHPDSLGRYWGEPSVAHGDGYVLASAEVEEDGAHGYFDEYRVIHLFGPSGQEIEINQPGGGGFTTCPIPGDPTAPRELADNAVAWNGSVFLVAKSCFDGLRVFMLDTAGDVTAQAAAPAAPGGFALASAGAGQSLLVWSQSSGSGDVRALRLDSEGLAIGAPITVAGGAVAQTAPAVAAAAGGYLVGWQVPSNGGDLAVRTVSSGGALGTTRTLVSAPSYQLGLELLAGAGGTWFSAWRDGRGPSNDPAIQGTKLSASGVPAQAGGRLLVAPTGELDPQPGLATGPDGTAFLSWIRSSGGDSLGAARRLDATGTPTGATTAIGRAPVPQSCTDVAAGQGQYLVTWQESRVVGNTNVYGQRYTSAGVRTGPVLTLSSAGDDQFCPTAAWNGASWLVVWTDERNGAADVYGTRVDGAGTVLDPSGIAISHAAGAQQSPVVAADGTRFVVAWNDGRNGNQDVFAARVTAAGTVLDANGLAVTTAPGVQRHPVVASTGGSTLVGWLDASGAVGGRILRTNGTFVAPAATIGRSYFAHFGSLAAAAGGGQLAVVHEDDQVAGDGTHRVLLTRISPSTGAVSSRTTVRTVPDFEGSSGHDLSHDGTRFMVTETRTASEELGGLGVVSSVTGSQVLRRTLPSASLNTSRIASLPDGTSLVVGDTSYATTITTARVDDDGV